MHSGGRRFEKVDSLHLDSLVEADEPYYIEAWGYRSVLSDERAFLIWEADPDERRDWDLSQPYFLWDECVVAAWFPYLWVDEGAGSRTLQHPRDVVTSAISVAGAGSGYSDAAQRDQTLCVELPLQFAHADVYREDRRNEANQDYWSEPDAV